MSRSGLVLKLLTHPDTGAIAAAPTTSLPEEIGGCRNWDYRFAWLRDAAFTAQGLASLGHDTEALAFLLWAKRVSQGEHEKGRRPQIMYGLHGETDLTEFELPHFEGYRGSRPVRVGNAASAQLQLDTFGELLRAAHEFRRMGGRIPDDLWPFLSSIADEAARRWRDPDSGIWEMRREPRHFVHSKVMVWVGLDRAIRMVEDGGMRGDVGRWAEARDEVRRAVLEHGVDEESGAFVQAFGSRDLDASNLVIPLVGFLPPTDPRVQRTLDLTLERLAENGLVWRYRSDDGLPGRQGAFGLATFWAVDGLALSGRLEEAEELFDGMAARANHLGLFPEEFGADGEFLGNFPQAFTHLGLLNAAIYLNHGRGRELSIPAPMGSAEHRRELSHE